MKNKALLEKIRAVYVLDWDGIHGAAHWERVRRSGLRLAESTGANVEVIEYFALLHDSCRNDDGRDFDHGPRAAAWILELGGDIVSLEPNLLELLVTAVRDHTRGFTAGDATVLTCWDADRLDIGRVGIRPNPKYLCTEAAKDPEVIDWGWRHSRGDRD